MSEDDKKESSSRGIWLVIIICGVLSYLLFVLPLRIIYKHPNNSIWRTLMPFSNILSAPAVGSFLMYGFASGSWLVLGVNFFGSYGNHADKEAVIIFSCVGTVATIASIWLAWKDVHDSMEELD